MSNSLYDTVTQGRQLKRQRQTALASQATNVLLAQQVELLSEQVALLRYIADTLNRMENRQLAAQERTQS